MADMSWGYLRTLPTGRLIVILVAGLLLVAAMAGAVLATRQQPTNEPQAPLAQDPSPAAEAPPTAEELQRVVDRLANAGVTTDADTVAGLAADHGVGGAVRLLWWSSESGTSVDELVAMRTGDADTPPMGWGQIAKELGLHPGIGSVMGGGHGRENAPGQNRDSTPPAP
jgi:hypothetical protein